MKNDNFDSTPVVWLRRYGVMAIIWSVLVGSSLLWDMRQETRNTLDAATAAARANINKDIIFRKWATSHGGVYVPPTEHTPPNPYLKLPSRDVVTTTGKELTLMNPAYMLRELQNDFSDGYGTRSHITSLKLLNPKNAPDAWEAGALRAFEQGEKERLEVQQIDGQPYLRMMLPLITETGCLKCHGFQGYKAGDIRGGVSTAVSMESFLAREKELSTGLVLTHGAIWLIGMAGLGFSYWRDRKLSAGRQQAEMELRELNNDFVTLLENTGDFIYFKDKDSRFRFCSQTLARITGHHSWRDMTGKHDLEVFPEDTARIYHEEEMPIFNEGKPLLNKIDPYYDARGKPGWVSTNKWPVFGDDGKTVVGIFGISRDITELKEAEDKINELNLDLERRVIERTAQLEVANKELEAFSYSVSHDLRAPLRAIDGFSHILQEDHADKLDDEGKRLLDVVRDNVGRMAQLIDDILKFSRTGRLEINFSRIDMEGLVRDVYEELRPQAGRELQVEIEHIPPATGDRAMMRQVFVNLLSNAIKFTRIREAARIAVGSYVKGNETVYFVKDNGVGFDMQFADKLFGVFQRLHGANEFEGTGIGLAIVKRIVTRHGGRVWAEGKVNEGATVYFAIPVKESGHD